MNTTERERDSMGTYVGGVVDAATTLAERATGSAAELAAQAVRDARRVASSFETLVEAAARDGVEMARDTMAAVREAAERAGERSRLRDHETSGDEA